MGKIVATHNRLVLKKLESQEKMYGSIVVPDAGGERSNLYEVIDVGPGSYNPQFNTYAPMHVKVGDIVIVPKAFVYNVMIDGEEYYTTFENEIHGIYVEE